LVIEGIEKLKFQGFFFAPYIFLFRFFLSLLPSGTVPPNIASAMTKFSRGVSSGEQSYQVWPSPAVLHSSSIPPSSRSYFF
jgi:hypothetical protein